MKRLKFFAQLRKNGFSKSELQMTWVGLTYEKLLPDGSTVRVTVPKSHHSTITILGNVPYSGIWMKANANVHWGRHVEPSDFGLENMLDFCIALIDGRLVVEPS
jgi:hypothetical protein